MHDLRWAAGPQWLAMVSPSPWTPSTRLSSMRSFWNTGLIMMTTMIILWFMNFKEATVWYEQRKNLVLRENGDLERLGRFWLHGVCKPNMQVRDNFSFFLGLMYELIMVTMTTMQAKHAGRWSLITDHWLTTIVQPYFRTMIATDEAQNRSIESRLHCLL